MDKITEDLRWNLTHYYAWAVEETQRKMVCVEAKTIVDLILWTRKRGKRLGGKPIYVTHESPESTKEWELCAVLEPLINGKYVGFLNEWGEYVWRTARVSAKIYWDCQTGWKEFQEWRKHYWATDSIRYVHI